MLFIGIIESNMEIVREIIQFFSHSEKYSLLFACPSTEEFKALPETKKGKANYIFLNSREKGFERIWEIKYIKQINPRGDIVLLLDQNIDEHQSSQLKKIGVNKIIYCSEITLALRRYFSSALPAGQYHESAPTIAPVSPALAAKPIPLTSREHEIIALVLKGYSNRKIAECMFISIYTVNAHLRKIFTKLSVKSRTAMIGKIIDEMVY